MQNRFLGQVLRLGAAVVACLVASSVEAHSGHHDLQGFLSGLAHPLSGVDHVLMALAAGMLWSQLAPRRMAWGAAIFAASLAVGYAGAAIQLVDSLPEALVAGSVLVLGLLLTLPRLAPPFVLGVVMLSALLHGLVHGIEADADFASRYVCGLELASLALFMAAAWIHHHIVRPRQQQAWMRAFGALCAAFGIAGLGLG